MADSRIPSDVMSFAKWGRTKIEFGKTMVRAVAKSQDLGFPQYPEKRTTLRGARERAYLVVTSSNTLP